MNTKDINYRDELILVVDDDEMTAKNQQELLKHLGFKVHYACSGSDAFAELGKGSPYTFLIADIVMPGMDGLELMREAIKKYPHICIIAMTGYSNEYKYVDVINAGASDFINKPFGIDELEAKIRRCIIERNTRQELERLSITDSLTGLYNQRHFYSRLNEEIMRAKRQNQQLALLLFDLDEFKTYNDEHGHVAGDKLLQKFGSIIKSQIRQGVDSSYRYGGDEFAVILVDADLDICQSIAKRIAKTFKSQCNGTVSMGLAKFSDGMTLESFLETADKHLYTFKGQKNSLKTGVRTSQSALLLYPNVVKV